MAIVEDLEEEVEKVPDATDSTTPSIPSRSGNNDVHGVHGADEDDGSEEEHDADGFETASEGEEDYDFSDSDAEKFELLGLKENDERIAGAAAERSTSDDSAVEVPEQHTVPEVETGREVAAVEQQPLTEEQAKQIRQQGIDEATKAKAEGNSFFGQGQYEEAVASYQKGLAACPLKDPEDSAVKEIRAVLYSNRAACFSHKQLYQEAVEESTKALELNPNYIKALTRRYQAKEKLELYDDAIVDAKKVLDLDPGNTQAKVSLSTLVPLAEEKREKMKAEMLAKLKEAGNSILGRFGMSVDNFKTVKDPNTGSYSIQFQR
ncbi:unnamed protein product [Calypogeia fissa]